MPERLEEEAVLMRRIANGDRAAFAVLYERYLPLLLSWSIQQTGDRELAADLTSEIFAAALIASSRYKPKEGSPLVAWLLGIARNKLRESWRRGRIDSAARRRLQISPLTLEDADLARVDELASLNSAVIDLLEALPPEQREAVTQRVIEERSYEEIAAELRCSESVIRQRVSRGLRTLRSEMEGS